MSSSEESDSILAKLDSVVPVPAEFDAFPKLPSTYKSRSESRGYLTIFVCFVTFLLMLNDIGEFIWGWPDFDFTVDHDMGSYLTINVDLAVNMPCQYLSIDLRDAIGDRLYLTSGLRRDGTLFDVGQAISLKDHSKALTASQVVKQSRSSRGIFDAIFRSNNVPAVMPKYKHIPHGSACRVSGQLEVKKVTANLHITTLGHGYQSRTHVPHDKMNLSHVISEFSFGPYFPAIVQPLDGTFEITHEHFVAYQYFLHVVPTTYIAPRTAPVKTNQYSVTHYTRILQHNQGTPGIFFKYDLDPLALEINQRTTSFLQLIVRCVGVIGGVFVCMGYAVRITERAVEAVTGADQAQGIVAAEASGVKVGLRAKWGGGTLRSRPTKKMIRQGSGWVAEDGSTNGGGSPYASYAGTPVSGAFATSPYLGSPAPGSGFGPYSPAPVPGSPNPSAGLGFPSSTGSTFGPPPMSAHGRSASISSSNFAPPPMGSRTPSLGVTPASPVGHTGGGRPVSMYNPSVRDGSPSPSLIGSGGLGGSTAAYPPLPGTPSYANFPPTPNPVNGGGFPGSGSPSPGPPPRRVISAPGGKKDD